MFFYNLAQSRPDIMLLILIVMLGILALVTHKEKQYKTPKGFWLIPPVCEFLIILLLGLSILLRPGNLIGMLLSLFFGCLLLYYGVNLLKDRLSNWKYMVEQREILLEAKKIARERKQREKKEEKNEKRILQS